MRALIVDADRRHAAAVARPLRQAGFVADRCATAAGALEVLASMAFFDLLLVDRELPEAGASVFCRVLRESGDRVPILVVSVRSEVVEKVLALDAGADDYLTKPVHP